MLALLLAAVWTITAAAAFRRPALQSIGLAAGAWLLAAFALARAGWATPAAFWILLAAQTAAAIPRLRALRPRRPRGADSLALAALAAMTVLAALAPPTGMDTGSYHYAEPVRWLRLGGLPDDGAAGTLQIGLMHFGYLAAFALEGERLAGLFSAGAAIVAALALARACETLAPGSRAGLLAAGPMLWIYGGTGYIEPAVAMFGALALLMAAERRTVSAALFLGLAVGVKATAAALLPMAILLWPGPRRGWAVLAFLAAAVPRYTLAFGPADRWAMSDELFVSMAGWPIWRLLGRFAHSVLVVGEYWPDTVGPAIVFFALLARRRSLWLPAAGLLILLAGAWHTGRAFIGIEVNGRYAAPILLVLGAWPAAVGLVRLRARAPRLAAAALWIPLLLTLPLKAGKTAVAAPAALGIESRDDYLSKKIESYPVTRTVNGIPGARVVFAGLRPYYLEVPYVRAGADLAADARAFGATHAIVEFEASVPPDWTLVEERRGVRLYAVSPSANR